MKVLVRCIVEREIEIPDEFEKLCEPAFNWSEKDFELSYKLDDLISDQFGRDWYCVRRAFDEELMIEN